MKINDIYQIYLQHPIICTDTREIKENCLFFCLHGANFDGNTFALDALKQGAAYVIVDNKEYASDSHCILVKDTLKTLQDLALFHRKQLHIPVIGITGTNGKTTTKELIKAVLSTKYNVLATTGNLNNHIGVPLTLLSINTHTEIAIVEMGANHANEIEDLCNIALPNLGLITNIGKAHLEGFHDIDTIIRTKTALYTAVKQADGKLFVNSDDNILMKFAHDIEKYTYGTNDNTDFVGKIIHNDLFLEILLPKTNTTLKTNLVGNYNFYNVMAAITVGRYFDINLDNIQRALESYFPTNSRSQILQKGSNTFIIDAYNANPSSMEVSIQNFSEIRHSNKVLILGDMKELGEESIKEHQHIVDLIRTLNFKHVFLLGDEFNKTACQKEWNYTHFESLKQAITLCNFQNSMILIKGSNAMKMERVLDIF